MGYGQDAEPLLTELIERTPGVIEAVRSDLPKGLSEQVADSVLEGLLNASRTLQAMPPA